MYRANPGEPIPPTLSSGMTQEEEKFLDDHPPETRYSKETPEWEQLECARIICKLRDADDANQQAMREYQVAFDRWETRRDQLRARQAISAAAYDVSSAINQQTQAINRQTQAIYDSQINWTRP
jgi:hypothetical protein